MGRVVVWVVVLRTMVEWERGSERLFVWVGGFGWVGGVEALPPYSRQGGVICCGWVGGWVGGSSQGQWWNLAERESGDEAPKGEEEGAGRDKRVCVCMSSSLLRPRASLSPSHPRKRARATGVGGLDDGQKASLLRHVRSFFLLFVRWVGEWVGETT